MGQRDYGGTEGREGGQNQRCTKERGTGQRGKVLTTESQTHRGVDKAKEQWNRQSQTQTEKSTLAFVS